MDKYITLAVIGILKLFSYLPFRLLYLVSDILYVVIYHIIRYRRIVVKENLRRSFPERGRDELRRIESEYYRYLCDITLETLKVGNMSEAGLTRRMTFKNCELINGYFDQGKSVVVLAMHYGNWEWLLHMPLFIKHHQYFVYKPMQNKWFGRYLNKMRSRFGGETVPMNIALRKIIEAEKKGMPVMTWLAADQTPPWNHPFWTIFLNQETQFFEGPARIAIRFGQPVILQTVRRTGRGYYEASFELLFENPQDISEETIILTYLRKIESIVKTEPYPYLWSHRRWKHTRPAGTPLHSQ